MKVYARYQVPECPVEASLELISGRWKARILWKLYVKKMRFGELRRSLPGITEKMLAQQLDEMEHNQLIIRTQYPEMPPRVEYSISPFGQSLGPVLEMLKTWGTEHRPQIVELLEASAPRSALETL